MGKNFLIYFRERFPSLQVYNLKQKSGIKPHKTKPNCQTSSSGDVSRRIGTHPRNQKQSVPFFIEFEYSSTKSIIHNQHINKTTFQSGKYCVCLFFARCKCNFYRNLPELFQADGNRSFFKLGITFIAFLVQKPTTL